MRESFIFFRSFFEAIESLDDDRERAEAYRALISYALDGIEEEQKGARRAIMMMAKPVLDFSRKQYENGVKGGRPKNPNVTQTKPKHNPNETQTEPKRNQNQNQDKNQDKNQDVSVNEERGPGKTPAGTQAHIPTVEEVHEYAVTIAYQLDAQSFIDKYAAQGWKVSGEPIRDWKALVRRWKTQEQKRALEDKPKIHNFDERGDDLDDETARKWREKIAARRAERERTSVV